MLNRSPDGNINLTSFNNFSAIVGMFTFHMKRLRSEDIPGEFKQFRQHMQRTSVLKDSGNNARISKINTILKRYAFCFISELMDASLLCETREENF